MSKCKSTRYRKITELNPNCAIKSMAESIIKKPKVNAVKQKKEMTLKLNKNLGQHLLKNTGIVDKILAAAEIKKSDNVLEIGPGTGNLTIKLCGLARMVRALEIDKKMVTEVKKRVFNSGYTNLEVICGDALKTDLGKFDICTANLPYKISSPFLFKLLQHPNKFRCAILMFQKEFGDRLIAQPGDKAYCRLSVNCKLLSNITKICSVSAKSFNPPPKVDSIVVKIVHKKVKTSVDMNQWDSMLRILFNRKNKTIASSLTTGKIIQTIFELYVSKNSSSDNMQEYTLNDFKEYLRQILSEVNFYDDESGTTHKENYIDKRPISLSVESFLLLLTYLNSKNIYFPVQNLKNESVFDE